MRIQIEAIGATPILLHNPQMCDPEFELNRQIKVFTSKRRKTDEDLKNIERLEWYGGLFLSNGSSPERIVVQPTSKLRKCLINTGKISKAGKMIERALSFAELEVPLHYEGPKEINDMYYPDSPFISRLSVVIGGKRFMRVRPKFFPWKMVATANFIEDAGLNFDEFLRIVELAGVVEGIGDNRANGYGRFAGKVVVQK